MTRTAIDPPHLAARLKQEGMAAEQADALARALGDELGRFPAPKPGAGARSDLEDPVKRARLTTEIRMFKWVFGFAILATIAAFVALFESLDRVRVQQSRNNVQMAVLETRMKERFDAVDERFDAVDRQFDAIDKQFDAVDKQFKAVDRQLDLIVQRIGGLEALLREALSRQRGGSAAGAGGPARPGSATRAPEGVMR